MFLLPKDTRFLGGNLDVFPSVAGAPGEGGLRLGDFEAFWACLIHFLGLIWFNRGFSGFLVIF